MPIKLYKNRHQTVVISPNPPVRLKNDIIFISFLVQNIDNKYIIAITTIGKKNRENKVGKEVVVILGWI